MAAAKSAKAIGEANAQLAERDAEVAKNNKIAIEQKARMDLERMEIEFASLQSQTLVNFRYRGVDPSDGTPLDIAAGNVSDYEYDRDVFEYNTTIAKQEQDEIATFARMKANIERMTGQAKAAYHKQAAVTSLLSGGSKAAMYGAQT
jgi:hypothetical protein